MISFYPWHCLVLAGLLLQVSAGPVFLQRTSRHVAEPGAVDGNLLREISDAPGNVLGLLHSPTCPDCEWLMKKVWTSVASKLGSDPSITVMTLADPGFAAPKPFEHWHNPAIFWAPKDNKMAPIFFPQARLQEYLAGIPSRPQDQQDSDFVEDLLVFAKGASGVALFSRPSTPAVQSKPLDDLARDADKGWAVLQGKWAEARKEASQSSPSSASMLASAQAVRAAVRQTQVVQEPHHLAMAYAEEFVRTHAGKGYTVPGLYKYALPYYEHHNARTAQPRASLMASAQTVRKLDVNTAMPQMPVVQEPHELAMAYAEAFVRTHVGQGYTVPGVYSYALPYYTRR